jgi:hypothetical protein
MEKDIDAEVALELTLLLAWLTGWDEQPAGTTLRYAWKWYDFALLDQLNEQGFIVNSRGKAPIILTPEGIARAKLLKEKYLTQRSVE